MTTIAIIPESGQTTVILYSTPGDRFFSREQQDQLQLQSQSWEPTNV